MFEQLRLLFFVLSHIMLFKSAAFDYGLILITSDVISEVLSYS